MFHALFFQVNVMREYVCVKMDIMERIVVFPLQPHLQYILPRVVTYTQQTALIWSYMALHSSLIKDYPVKSELFRYVLSWSHDTPVTRFRRGESKKGTTSQLNFFKIHSF